MQKHIWAFLALPFFFLFSCKTAQKTLLEPPAVPTEKTLLWRVEGPKMKHPSYVFGTIHMIPKKDFDLSEEAETALFACKKIVYEINLSEMTSISALFTMIPKSMMAGGKTLKSLVSAEDYALLKSKFSEKGLPLATFERLKPMFTAMALGDESGSPTGGKTDKMTAVEMELQKFAKRKKLESAGLETVEIQMAVFDSIPYEVQAKMLVDGLKKGGNEGENDEFEAMIAAYKSQDISKMASMIADENEGFAEYADLFLGNRNRRWIPKIAEMMREKPCFFAVGAGHLGGEKGVIFLLRKAGFRVKPILAP